MIDVLHKGTFIQTKLWEYIVGEWTTFYYEVIQKDDDKLVFLRYERNMSIDNTGKTFTPKNFYMMTKNLGHTFEFSIPDVDVQKLNDGNVRID